jgi:DNA modification methylase
MGSGTTCVVAKRLKREWIGIEKENKYFNIANRRVNQISED